VKVDAAVLANPEPHIGKVYDLTGTQSLLGRAVHRFQPPNLHAAMRTCSRLKARD
jgi:hypothetical protein